MRVIAEISAVIRVGREVWGTGNGTDFRYFVIPITVRAICVVIAEIRAAIRRESEVWRGIAERGSVIAGTALECCRAAQAHSRICDYERDFCAARMNLGLLLDSRHEHNVVIDQ